MGPPKGWAPQDVRPSTGATELWKWLDPIAPRSARLYPDDDAARSEVEALEDVFDETLGPATRRWGYSWALHDRALMLELMSLHASRTEIAILRAGFPFIIPFMVRGLRLSDEAIDTSLARIAKVFEDMGKKLEGRRYLVGDSLSAADLTFAALGSPVVVPPEHPLAHKLADAPKPMRRTIDAMRELPAGRFISRIYREHRREKVP